MGFLSNLFGDQPAPPNPLVTAGAQTASNINTAVSGAYLNNMNQVTPTGNLNYDVTGNYDFRDPLTGASYSIPRFTATQTQTPTGQATTAANERTSLNLANTGEASSNRIGSILGTNFADTLAGAPGTGDINWMHKSGAAGGNIADVGGLTRDYGPADNFSEDRKRIEESMYQRMNPQLEQDRGRLEQQLADQGLQPGTEAYDRAYDALARQTTDARLAITAKGGEEQQRLNDMAAQRATFQNSAQRDAFTQAASRAQFSNAAEAQNFARASSLFDAQNRLRDKWLQEQYALRGQPISEISALQSGSQVQQPNFVGGGNAQVANTDIAGIINANFGQSLENYKQNSSNVNNIIGGAFGALGSAYRAASPTSDRRAKKNIARVGSVYAARRHDEPRKLPIYSYEYRDGHEDGGAMRHVGPMAQDVERIDPGAVTEIGGVKHIKTRRVLGDILRVA
jgi:hypothetical protein